MTENPSRLHAGLGVLAVLCCVTLLAIVDGCHGSHIQPAPLPEPIVLVVHNQAFFDVNVYVMPSPSGMGVRLATVTGNTTATLRVPANELQMGYVLVVRLHAIGTSFWWDSPSVTMDQGSIAKLDITSDPSGNLSRSSLYLAISDTTDGAGFGSR